MVHSHWCIDGIWIRIRDYNLTFSCNPLPWLMHRANSELGAGTRQDLRCSFLVVLAPCWRLRLEKVSMLYFRRVPVCSWLFYPIFCRLFSRRHVWRLSLLEYSLIRPQKVKLILAWGYRVKGGLCWWSGNVVKGVRDKYAELSTN